MRHRIIKSIYQENSGALVEHFRIDKSTDYVHIKMRYFPLSIEDDSFVWEEHTTLDNNFVMPREEFLKQFRILANADEMERRGSFSYAVWDEINSEELDILNEKDNNEVT